MLKEEKFDHNRSKSVSDKPIILEGYNIWYRNNVKNIWDKGTIVDRDDTSDRSYTLVGENGKILSHNCINLKIFKIFKMLLNLLLRAVQMPRLVKERLKSL